MRVNFKCSYFHTPRTNFAATLKNPSYQLGTNKQLNNFVHFIIPVYKLIFFLPVPVLFKNCGHCVEITTFFTSLKLLLKIKKKELN